MGKSEGELGGATRKKSLDHLDLQSLSPSGGAPLGWRSPGVTMTQMGAALGTPPRVGVRRAGVATGKEGSDHLRHPESESLWGSTPWDGALQQ